MGKIVRRLMRLFCAVVGHDWAPPVPVALYHIPDVNRSNFWRTECLRCDRTINGDWDWMEINHAWKRGTP